MYTESPTSGSISKKVTEIEVREAGRPKSLDFIKKKMDGGKLSKEETLSIIKDVVNDDISAAELTAFITATYINPLDMDEVEHLTRAMVETGEQIKFSSRPIVDKHSIGGVPGNKISLLVVPIIAASGLKIPKTSSRAITGAGGRQTSWKCLRMSSSRAAKSSR